MPLGRLEVGERGVPVEDRLVRRTVGVPPEHPQPLRLGHEQEVLAAHRLRAHLVQQQLQLLAVAAERAGLELGGELGRRGCRAGRAPGATRRRPGRPRRRTLVARRAGAPEHHGEAVGERRRLVHLDRGAGRRPAPRRSRRPSSRSGSHPAVTTSVRGRPAFDGAAIGTARGSSLVLGAAEVVAPEPAHRVGHQAEPRGRARARPSTACRGRGVERRVQQQLEVDAEPAVIAGVRRHPGAEVAAGAVAGERERGGTQPRPPSPTQLATAHTSSNAAGNGCSGASR